MGAAASQCTRACCSCCCRDDSKATKSRVSETSTVQHDRDDAWFEHDNLPLLSAAHEDEGMTSRKVMAMRSPRHAEPVAASSPRHGPVETLASSAPSRRKVESASPERGLRPTEETGFHSPRQTWGDDNSPNSSNDDDSWELASSGRTSGNEQSPPPKVRSPRSQLSGATTEDDESKATTIREASRSPDHNAEHTHRRSHRSISAASNEVSEAFDDNGDATGSPRSPRSPGRPASASGSPKRKPRYGRKHYRADSNRQKNA